MSKTSVKPKDEDERRVFEYDDDFSYKDFEEESTPKNLVFPLELNSHLRTKIRDLTSENGTLRRTLQETEGKLGEMKISQDRQKNAVDRSSKDEEVKSMQERLNQVNCKYYKCQNTCLSLRQELHKAQKLLCSEVGDNVTISSLLNHPGGWKGRAEQIQQLQQKVSELQHKLNVPERSVKSSAISLEQRTSYRTKSMERERRTVMEHLGRELRQAETALECNKKKLEAARARIKVLENEAADAKRNLIILSDRTIHDDQLIEALNGQLRAVEDRYKDRDLDYRGRIEKITQECSNMKNEVYSSKLMLEQVRKRLSERETEINMLRSSARTEVDLNHQDSPKKSHNRSPLGSFRSPQDPNEYVILGLASEAEREKLMDVVAALNHRLAKERSDADHVSELLRRERSKLVKLENKLQKIESDRVTRPRINSGYRSRSSKSLTSSKNDLNEEQFKYKLELLEEENLALKARITTLQQEKIEDLSTYKQLLENTRRIFHDSFRGQISTAHST